MSRRWARGALVALLLLASAPLQAVDDEGRVHVVQPGESLWSIARQTVGDPRLWPALYEANRDQIKDPTRVYPGQRLVIPDIDPEKRGALRREAAEQAAP